MILRNINGKNNKTYFRYKKQKASGLKVIENYQIPSSNILYLNIKKDL